MTLHVQEDGLPRHCAILMLVGGLSMKAKECVGRCGHLYEQVCTQCGNGTGARSVVSWMPHSVSLIHQGQSPWLLILANCFSTVESFAGGSALCFHPTTPSTHETINDKSASPTDKVVTDFCQVQCVPTLCLTGSAVWTNKKETFFFVHFLSIRLRNNSND